MAMTEARGAVFELASGIADRFPEYGVEADVYVTAPGAEIAEDDPVVAAIDDAHRTVHGHPPDRDVVRWFSDASVLTRYGVATVNYGASSGLPGEEGESVEVRELVDTARVYALAAAQVCEVAE
jgi:acetylornithine deacetylase/succinyl-diaminopimelate desuccinylase-like protein